MSDLPPLVSPALLKKASEEIDAMVSNLIPEGKQGALVVVVERETGARVGLVTKLGPGDLVVSATLQQRWAREKPSFRIEVRTTW